MRTDTRYVCETCGMGYRSRALALACEATVLPPCPVAPGDAVGVAERYDGIVPDVVEEVSVTYAQRAFFMTELDDAHGMVVDQVEGRGRPLHRWEVRVRDSHQMGKDGDSHTDTLSLGDLVVDGRRLDGAA